MCPLDHPLYLRVACETQNQIGHHFKNSKFDLLKGQKSERCVSKVVQSELLRTMHIQQSPNSPCLPLVTVCEFGGPSA